MTRVVNRGVIHVGCGCLVGMRDQLPATLKPAYGKRTFTCWVCGEDETWDQLRLETHDELCDRLADAHIEALQACAALAFVQVDTKLMLGWAKARPPFYEATLARHLHSRTP